MNCIYIVLFLGFSLLLAAEEENSNPFIGKQGVIVDSTEWPGVYDKVVAAAYDYTQDKSDLLIVDKKLHRGVFSVSEPLSKKQIDTLFSSITGKHTPWKPAMCFEPHHGFIFYDKNDAVVGSISICFHCKRFRLKPSGEVSAKWDWEQLRKLLDDLKIPFPEDYTKAYKAGKTSHPTHK